MAFRPLKAFGGFLDRMVPQENYGGLLSPQDQRAAAQAFRAQLASGLLSAAGPQRMPVSLGQALGAAMPQAMAARDQRAEVGLRNDQLRRQIERENKDNAARAKLGGLFGAIGGPDGDLLRAVNDVDPRLAVGLLSAQAQQQEQRDPNDLQMMDALGLPRTPEGFAKYKQLDSDPGMRQMLDALNLQIQGLNLKNMEREQELAARTERETRLTQQNAINNGLDQAAKLAEVAKKLEGSIVQTGLPAGDWRRQLGGIAAGAGQAFGLDTAELEADLAAFDKYKKGLSDQLIALMATGDLGAGTNSKLQQYNDALAKPETELAAALGIQGNIIRDYLDTATVKGLEVRDRGKYEALIEEFSDYHPPESAAEPTAPNGKVIRPADIGRMSLDQLRELDPASMTPELRDAAERRWDALGAE